MRAGPFYVCANFCQSCEALESSNIHRPVGWTGHTGSIFFPRGDCCGWYRGQLFQILLSPLYFPEQALTCPSCFLWSTVVRKYFQVMSLSKFHVLQSNLWDLGFNAGTIHCKHDVSLSDNRCACPGGCLASPVLFCEHNRLVTAEPPVAVKKLCCTYITGYSSLMLPLLLLFLFLVSCQLLVFCRDAKSSLQWA